MKLTFHQKVQMAVRGYAFSHHEARNGWKKKLPFFIIKCPEHGYQVNYVQGFRKEIRCPECAPGARFTKSTYGV